MGPKLFVSSDQVMLTKLDWTQPNYIELEGVWKSFCRAYFSIWECLLRSYWDSGSHDFWRI